MSRAGRCYRAANGTRIKNLGEMAVNFLSPEGHRCSLPVQVAEVEKPLVAVSQLAAAGNVVELGSDGGCITNKRTGMKLNLTRRDGVYVLPMKVPAAASGFPRPEC